LPSLENLHQHFKGEAFALLGIDLQEDRETVLKSIQKYNLSYTNLLDSDGLVAARYGVRSSPTKVLIDAEGNLVGIALGYRQWDSEEMKVLIKKLMKREK